MKKKTLSTIFAIAISAFFLWLAFSRIDFKMLIQSFKSINWIYAIPFIVITWLSFLWRTFRWQNLLEPYRKISLHSLFGPMMIAFAFNSIFPARAGEIARPYALYKTEKVPVTTGFSTVVLERLCDIIMLLILFALTLFFMEFDESLSRSYDARKDFSGEQIRLFLNGALIAVSLLIVAVTAWVYLRKRKQVMKDGEAKASSKQKRMVALFGFVAFLFVLVAWFFMTQRYPADTTHEFGNLIELNASKFQEIAKGISVLVVVIIVGSVCMISRKFRALVEWVLTNFPFIPSVLRTKLIGIFQGFATGFDSLRDWKLASKVAFHTFMVWFLTGASFWIMAFGVPNFDLTLPLAMVFLVITCIVISIPAAPGFWGLYEVGGVVALILCGVVPDTPEGTATALGFTLVVHFFQWALVTIIGLYYAGKIHISAKDVALANAKGDGDIANTERPA